MNALSRQNDVQRKHPIFINRLVIIACVALRCGHVYAAWRIIEWCFYAIVANVNANGVLVCCAYFLLLAFGQTPNGEVGGVGLRRR